MGTKLFSVMSVKFKLSAENDLTSLSGNGTKFKMPSEIELPF